MDAEKAVKNMDRRLFNSMNALLEGIHDWFDYLDSIQEGRKNWGESYGDYAQKSVDFLDFMQGQTSRAWQEADDFFVFLTEKGFDRTTYGEEIPSSENVMFPVSKKDQQIRDEEIERRFNFDEGNCLDGPF